MELAITMTDKGIGTSLNSLMAIEGFSMRRMTRASKIVRATLDDETVFPFNILTVEPGKSWTAKKAKALKNAAFRRCALCSSEHLCLSISR